MDNTTSDNATGGRILPPGWWWVCFIVGIFVLLLWHHYYPPEYCIEYYDTGDVVCSINKTYIEELHEMANPSSYEMMSINLSILHPSWINPYINE